MKKLLKRLFGEKITPFHYTVENNKALDWCYFKNNDTKIGSVGCQKCEHYKGGSTSINTVLCSQIRKATKIS